MMRNEFSFKTTISKEEINDLTVDSFSGEIFYIDTFDKLERVLPILKEEKVLGFDTETRPSFKKGKTNEVSLLQFSSSNSAYLFRLNKIGLPNEICEILASKNVQKVGVAIRDDILSLKKINSFESNGFVELQQYVKDFGIIDNGLKKLTANILGFKISKRQQTSNWEAETLSEAQIIYAATDAWVCHEIYSVLNQPEINEED
jgi:ribonuclease D